MRMLIAGLLMSSAAMAQDNFIIYNPLIVQSQVGPTTIVEMQDGSCMRGPIVIRQFDGTEAFRLKAGEWFPADCKDHPDAWKTK